MATIIDLQTVATAALVEAKSTVAAVSSKIDQINASQVAAKAELAAAKAAHDAIAIAHAAASGAMTVAPTVESLWGKVKPYVIPGGVIGAGALGYAHFVAKLF